MTLSILSWIVCGLLVGLGTRYLVQERRFLSLSMTMLLSIVGALVGGVFYSLIRGASAEPFSMTSHNTYGWIVSILGAMLVLWVYPYVAPRKWSH